jgi:DNA-binding transcriptional LysR family regulator
MTHRSGKGVLDKTTKESLYSIRQISNNCQGIICAWTNSRRSKPLSTWPIKGSLARAALGTEHHAGDAGAAHRRAGKALGVKLMHRSTRHLTLTEQGTLYLDHCRKLLADLGHADRMVSEGRHRATGHLIVSAPAAFGRKHVAPHAAGFVRAHPDVQISFNLTDRVVDLVRDGYDVGIRIGGVIDPSFVAVKLASNRRVVCGTPDYFERNGTAAHAGRPGAAQLPGLQPAGRPATRLVFPASGQAGDGTRRRQS